MDIIFSNNKPKYIDIFEHFVGLITDGKLKYNDKLPSKRNLAIELNVSINTIMNSYNMLLSEGYIYTKEKSGYYVEDNLKIITKHQSTTIEKKDKENILYDFRTINIDYFADTTWKKILKTVLDDQEYLDKASFNGDISLINQIRSHLAINKGIIANNNQIIIGCGMEIFEHILPLINIDNVTLENPGYHKLKSICDNINIKANYISLDEDGVLVPDNKTILYTTDFNQFPTGIKMSIKRKLELVNFIKQTGSYIIEDDFDSEFRINSNYTKSLFSLSDNVIFFSTFSTTVYPGLRIAYVVLPNSLVEEYNKKYMSYSSVVPKLEQLTLAKYISDGHYATHINKRKKLYIKKRELCMKLLDENNISYYKNKNYQSILIDLDKYNIDMIKQSLIDNNIKINFISDYDINHNNKNLMILGYTAIDLDKLENAINTLIRIIKNGS